MFELQCAWDPLRCLPEGGPAILALDLVPRLRVTVLLDRSGSMAGLPLQRACRVIGALEEVVGGRDNITVRGFSTRADRQPIAIDRMPSVSAGGASVLAEALAVVADESDAGVGLVLILSDGYPTTASGKRLLDRSALLSAVSTIVGQGVNVRLGLVGPSTRAVTSLSDAMERAGVRVVTFQEGDPAATLRTVIEGLRAPATRAGASSTTTLELELGAGWAVTAGVLDSGGQPRQLAVQPGPPVSVAIGEMLVMPATIVLRVNMRPLKPGGPDTRDVGKARLVGGMTTEVTLTVTRAATGSRPEPHPRSADLKRALGAVGAP